MIRLKKIKRNLKINEAVESREIKLKLKINNPIS